MSNKKHRLILLLDLSLILLSGCAETPLEVQDEISRLEAHQISSSEDNTNKKVPISELMDYDNDDNGNIVIDDILIPHTDTICCYQLAPVQTDYSQSHFQQICQSILNIEPDISQIESFSDDIFLTDSSFPNGRFTNNEISDLGLHYPIQKQYWCEIDDSKPSISETDTGIISFSKGFDMIVSPYLLDGIETEKICYEIDWSNTELEMYDNNIWAAIDCAKYVNETFKEIDTDKAFSYQPFSITVRKIGTKYGYWVLMQRVAPDGVPVYPFFNLNTSSINSKSDFPLHDYSWCWCVRKNEVQELFKSQNFDILTQTALNELISLSAAKKIAEQELATQRSYHVTARLGHCLKLYGSKVSEITQNEFLEAIFYSDYERIALEPYWIFTEDDGENEIRYLVNAQTGAFEIR